MVDIFDEVSDDLRAERTLRLARRYGLLVLGAAVAVVLGVALQQTYAWYQGKQDQKAAAAYLTITAPIDAAGPNQSDAERKQDAEKLTQFAASAPAGYRTLATLRAAALYSDAGDAAQAEKLWTRLGQDSGADPLLRDLANLLWAQHALGHAPDDAVMARLKPLVKTSNPYHALAQETEALLDLHAHKPDLGKALLTQIGSDPDAPEQVRARANLLLEQLNG